MAKNQKTAKEEQTPPPPEPTLETTLTGQTSQAYDGEADPAALIKARNQERVYKQHGLPWPPADLLPPQPVPPVVIPTIDTLDPDSAVIGGEDVVLVVHGSDFSPDSVIVFNGGDEPTAIISDTEVSTTVKPSLAEAAVVVPVAVRNSAGTSDELSFSFEEPPVTRTRR